MGTEGELRERLARGSGEPEDCLELANLLVAAGRYEESITILRQAADLPVSGLERARLFLEVGWGLYERPRGPSQRCPSHGRRWRY